jgi:RNA polymerase sigma-70 factor (ECF subfamily)
VSDEELVDLARQGDADAFDQLVARPQAAAYRTALAALRSPSVAGVVAQDAFVRAWRSLDRFRGDSSFRTWIVTITWNRAMSRRRTVLRWLRGATTLDAVAPVAEPRAEAAAQGRELRAQIVAAIDALSPKLRDALLLAQTGEYGYDEIGTMLGIPVGTVKWRISEARKKVRAHLVVTVAEGNTTGSVRSEAAIPGTDPNIPVGFRIDVDRDGKSQQVPMRPTLPLNFDVRFPRIYEDRGISSIQANISVEYQPYADDVKTPPATIRAGSTSVFENGKKTVMLQAADPVSDRRTTIEVTATVVR